MLEHFLHRGKSISNFFLTLSPKSTCISDSLTVYELIYITCLIGSKGLLSVIAQSCSSSIAILKKKSTNMSLKMFRKVLYMLALCSPCNKYSCNYKCVKVMFESQLHYFSLMRNFIPLMTVLYLSLKI